MEQAQNQEADASVKKKSVWWEKWLFTALIISTIAFFMAAAGGAYSPDEVFKKLFGFIVIASVFIGVLALIGALIIRVGGLLFSKSK